MKLGRSTSRVRSSVRAVGVPLGARGSHPSRAARSCRATARAPEQLRRSTTLNADQVCVGPLPSLITESDGPIKTTLILICSSSPLVPKFLPRPSASSAPLTISPPAVPTPAGHQWWVGGVGTAGGLFRQSPSGIGWDGRSRVKSRVKSRVLPWFASRAVSRAARICPSREATASRRPGGTPARPKQERPAVAPKLSGLLGSRERSSAVADTGFGRNRTRTPHAERVSRSASVQIA